MNNLLSASTVPAPQQASRRYHCPSSSTAFHMCSLFCCWHHRPPQMAGLRPNPGTSTQLKPASLFRESPGEVIADQTPLCTCFLGEQPNLLGKYNLLHLKARAPLVQAVGQSAFIHPPAFPTATPIPHPSYLWFWLICQSHIYSFIQAEEEEGGSCSAQGRGGQMMLVMPNVSLRFRSSRGKENKARSEFYLHISWHKWA